MKRKSIICTFFAILTACKITVNSCLENDQKGNLKYIYTKTDEATQAEAGEQAVRRLLPSRHSDFVVRVDKNLTCSPYNDAIELQWDQNTHKIIVTGTTGVAALFGFHHYLKYYCNCHLSWEGRQINLPEILPKVSLRLNVQDRFRYYQNVCTDSYSFVWWDWSEWEEHIDWMALNGINLPLAFTGQEAIWKKIYSDLGLSEEDIDSYLTGPAFLAWDKFYKYMAYLINRWRMGNIQRWAGPLPKSYLARKHQLLKRIVQRMTSLGMMPVLPAFSGNVPEAITKIFPNATVVRHPSWNNFNSSYSSNYLLLPTDPLFIEIGKRFVQEVISDIGTSHIYSCDTFNENRPSNNDSVFLHNMAAATYASMMAGDEKAVWLLQSWLFTDGQFWKSEQVQSYLSGVEVGNALVLDLEAELVPLYLIHKSFYNHSFIWCMLHNFGGTDGLYGALDLVNEGIEIARRGNNSLIGTGMCPEGINQNYVMYDFMSEASLLTRPANISTWTLQFQERRYGVQDQNLSTAWQLLIKQVYNAPPLLRYHGRSVITRRPNFKLKEPIWYHIGDVRQAVQHFVQFTQNVVQRNNSTTIESSSLVRYDIVDFTRQLLQVLGSEMYKSLLGYYFTKNQVRFTHKGRQLLDLFDDLDILLATDKHFLVGPWIADAERWGNTTKEKKLMRYNALNQITLWGPNGEIVDYAAKQWAGVVSTYYKPRWVYFVSCLNSSLIDGKTFSYNKYREKVLKQVEIPFTQSEDSFPTNPIGDSISEARRIFYKWNKMAQNYERKLKKGRKKPKKKPPKNLPLIVDDNAIS